MQADSEAEIQRQEIYQHDLLKLVVRARRGTETGAHPLYRLLEPGCGPLSNPWIPYFKLVIDIWEFPSWRNLNDVDLTHIRAEAYETSPSEPTLADNAFTKTLRREQKKPG